MIRMLAVTASRSEASEAAQHMPEGESGSESITGAKRRHVPPAYIPGCHQKRADQAAGKNSAGLQRVKAEDLTPVAGIGIPFIDDEQDLGSENAGQNYKDSEVPGVVAVDALLFGVAYADPHSDQHARRNQQAIGGKAEIANMKKSGKHVKLDAPLEFDVREV